MKRWVIEERVVEGEEIDDGDFFMLITWIFNDMAY
jgi:hypothetical protein